MTDREILIKFVDKETKGIYGYKLGNPWIGRFVSNGGMFYERNEIIFIKKESLKYWTDKGVNTGFYYVSGWPKSDYSVYFYKDYGKTWAFTKDEIIITKSSE